VYSALKYVHVVLATLAVGFNASYAVWIARAAREPQYLAYSLRGVKFIDDRLANPAYALLLVTGLLMVWRGPVSLHQFWIATALVLYVILMGLGGGVYTPTLRKQISALETSGPGSAEYRRLSARGTAVGALLGVLVLAIVFLMVVKPTI
jgi:uncharacterized membrane protein